VSGVRQGEPHFAPTDSGSHSATAASVSGRPQSSSRLGDPVRDSQPSLQSLFLPCCIPRLATTHFQGGARLDFKAWRFYAEVRPLQAGRYLTSAVGGVGGRLKPDVFLLSRSRTGIESTLDQVPDPWPSIDRSHWPSLPQQGCSRLGFRSCWPFDKLRANGPH
jgi:hypothetical protein